MSVPQNFRKSFNGFHKEDVVQYLEYINTKHNNQVNQLNNELEELRERLTQADPGQQERIVELEEECAELTGKLAAAEAELEQLRSHREEVPVSENLGELEMYRRAEKTEQEARDRAELIYYQASSVLAEATGKVEGVSGEIMEMADQILSQLTKLQMMVSSSKQVLQEASSLLNIIRPNK